MSDIRLDFGPVGASLDLVDADRLADQRPFWFSTLADGFNLGSPEASRIIVASLMRDGDDERIDRYGNRTVTFDVQVHARTPHDLGLGEKALGRLVGTRTLLRWTPPGDVGSLTRFVVLTSEMAQIPNDLDEMREIRTRTWRLTLTCEPHGTSEAPVSQTFLPSTAAATTQDNATSLARWSGENLSLTTYGGRSAITAPRSPFRNYFTFTPATPITTEYVGVDIANANKVYIGTAFNDSPPPVSIELSTGGFHRYWFRRRESSTNYPVIVGAKPGVDPYIGGFYSSNTLNTSGLVVTEVDGSARTEGSFAISRASGMAWVLAYADPAMLDSGYSPAVQSSWAQAPAGRYMLAAKGEDLGFATGTVTTTVTDETGRAQVETTLLTATSATYRPLGEFDLGSRQDGTVGELTVVVSIDPDIQAPIDLRLFRLGDDTSLTLLEPPASVTTVSIDAASLEDPLPALWADGFSAEDRAIAWSTPTLYSGQVALFVEAPNYLTSPITTTVSYWPRWRGFAP